MKPRDVVRKLLNDGWYELPQLSTAHRQFKHPVKTGKVTVTVKGGREIRMIDVESIRKQAGISRNRWQEL